MDISHFQNRGLIGAGHPQEEKKNRKDLGGLPALFCWDGAEDQSIATTLANAVRKCCAWVYQRRETQDWTMVWATNTYI